MARLPLRGRADELSSALSVLRTAARTGQGAVVLLTGEPGIGVSTLGLAIMEQAARTGFAVGSSKAEEIEQIAPGAPLLVALRSGAHPLLGTAEFAGLAEVAAQPLWLVDRIAGLIETVALTSPVLIVVDDVQWADPLSRFALRILPGRLAGSPVVWMFGARDPNRADLDEMLTSFAVDRLLVRNIPLGPLQPKDVDDLAQDYLGELPTGRARELLDGVDGSPFLAVQLLAGLASARAAGQDEDEVPAALVLGIRRRLRSLAPASLALLQIAAVLGRPLPVEDGPLLLGPQPEDAELAPDWLQVVVADGLMVQDGPLVRFRHDLVRESVYADIGPSRRRELHRQCTRYLLRTGQGAVAAAAHARVAATAGDEESVQVLRQAAADSVEVQPETAAELIQQAWQLLEPGHRWWLEVGEQCVAILARTQRGTEAVNVADLLLAQTPEPEARARIQVLVSEALWSMGMLTELAERAGSALSGTGVSAPLRARLEASRALTLTRTDPPALARAAAEAALAEGIRLADPPAEQLALQALGEACLAEGRHGAALEYFRRLRERGGSGFLSQEITALQLLDRYDESGELLARARARADVDTLLPSLVFGQLWQDFNLGRFDDAEAGANTLIRLSDELGSDAHALEAWIVLVMVTLLRGDLDLARDRLAQAQQHGHADDDLRGPAIEMLRGFVTAAGGDLDGGAEILRPLLASTRNARSYWPWPGWVQVFAPIGKSLGDEAFAREAASVMTVGAARNPEVASYAGVALQLRGIAEHDVTLLAEAVEVLKPGLRPVLLGNARADHGAALLAAGERRRGIAELDQAWRIFHRIGARPAMFQVQSLLQGTGVRRKQWGASPDRPASGWAALTEGESRVAQLIGAGHTNRSAALELNLSANTVATHLRAVFTKLDIRSRVQLANLMHAIKNPDE